MITDALRNQLTFTHQTIHANLAGVTHEESLERAGEGANCLNWVLGHIVHSRRLVLDHFDAGPPMDMERGVIYARGAQPVGPGSDAVPLEELLRALDTTQERIMELLSGADEGFYQAQVPGLFEPEQGEVRGVQLAGIVFHECYHSGQLGVIRHAIGKAPAIQ